MTWLLGQVVTPEMIRLAPDLYRRLPTAGPAVQAAMGGPVRRSRRPLAASPVIVRFLIDECLSVDPVAVASRAGHDAHIGEAG